MKSKRCQSGCFLDHEGVYLNYASEDVYLPCCFCNGEGYVEESLWEKHTWKPLGWLCLNLPSLWWVWWVGDLAYEYEMREIREIKDE